jgi:perosamine synthetase
MSIPFSRPSIQRKDMDAVLTCLVEDTLGPGDVSQRFSAALAEFLGTNHGYAFREYQRAIAAACAGLDLSPGARVGVPVLAPDLYRQVLETQGLVPVYLDIRSSSLAPVCSDQQLDAMILYHHLGVPLSAEGISPEIPVIEDVSESLGASIEKEKIGRLGRFVIVSLEPEQIITAGGGAAVLPKGRKERSLLRDICEAGPSTVLLPDMNAALGLTQIKSIERFIHRRREIGEYFEKALSAGKHETLSREEEAECVYRSFPVLCAGGARDAMEYAGKKKIATVQAFADSVLARMIARESVVASDGSAPEQQSDGAAGVQAGIGRERENSGSRTYTHARNLFLRTVLFPVYPTLRSADVEELFRVLSSLP